MITVIPIVVASLDFFLAWRSGGDLEFTAGTAQDDDTFVFVHPDDASGVVFQGSDYLRNLRLFREDIFALLEIVMSLLLCAYLPTRISLIAQALAGLRAPPPSAYVQIKWTNYFPHIA
jgi:hypothetical protein